MAIRLRSVGLIRVALCAAETDPETGDVYLDDGDHYALAAKFAQDWKGQTVDWSYPVEWGAMATQKQHDAKQELHKWLRKTPRHPRPERKPKKALLDEMERLQRRLVIEVDDPLHYARVSQERAEAAEAVVWKLREALDHALLRLQFFLDTHGDMGENYETQSDINDWLDTLDEAGKAVGQNREPAAHFFPAKAKGDRNE